MRHLLAALLLVAAVAGDVAAAGAPIATSEPKPLPELAFETMDGTPATLDSLRGRVVVLNLWATWCAPCREEMPALDRLAATFKDAPVTVLALSVDRAGPERVKQFLDEIGVSHVAVYRDPKAAASRALKVPGLPATLLIDRNGMEVGRVLGLAAWDGPDAEAAVRKLLGDQQG